MEIVLGNYTNDRGAQILKTLFTSDDFDTKINEYEEFYRLTSKGDFNTFSSDNDDIMTTKIQSLIKNENFLFIRGLLEGFSILMIIISLDYSTENVKNCYIFIFIIQILSILTDFAFLMTQNLTSDDIFRVLNIIASFIAITMIMMVLINTNPLFYKEFFDNNLIFGKILGVIIVLKALYFY